MGDGADNQRLETTAYSPLGDARERLKDVEGKVQSLRDEMQRHYATKSDLEKAKVWMIVTVGGAIISAIFGCISVAILLMRMFGVG